MEKFLSLKTGRTIKDSNISDWRRTVCGDLTSIFNNAVNNESAGLEFLQKKSFLESIHNAKFKKVPDDFKLLNPDEIRVFQKNPYDSPYMPQQETGIRPSNGLFYHLHAEGKLNPGKKSLDIRFESDSKVFGEKTLGSPFNVYAPGKYLQNVNGSSVFKEVRTWAFAVKSSGHVEYSWPLESFENNLYHLRVYGPNGFYRELKGSIGDPLVDVQCLYEISGSDQKKLTGNISLNLKNDAAVPLSIQITDNAYKSGPLNQRLKNATDQAKNVIVPINLSKQFGWYDFTVTVEGNEVFSRRYAGRVDTGESGFSDPFMGRII
jgi:phospholipase C